MGAAAGEPDVLRHTAARQVGALAVRERHAAHDLEAKGKRIAGPHGGRPRECRVHNTHRESKGLQQGNPPHVEKGRPQARACQTRRHVRRGQRYLFEAPFTETKREGDPKVKRVYSQRFKDSFSPSRHTRIAQAEHRLLAIKAHTHHPSRASPARHQGANASPKQNFAIQEYTHHPKRASVDWARRHFSASRPMILV